MQKRERERVLHHRRHVSFALIIVPIFILITTVILLLELHYSAKREVIQRFQVQQLFTTLQLSKELESYLRDKTRAIEILSSSSSLKNKNIDEMAAAVQGYFEYLKKDHVKSIIVYNEKGTIIYSTWKDAVSLKHNDSNFFTWATQIENKGKQFITSEIPSTLSQFSKNSTFRIMIVAPIYSGLSSVEAITKNPRKKEPADKFVGIVSVIVDLDEILTTFFPSDSSHSIKQNAWLLDKSGTVLFQIEHPEMVMYNVHQQEESCWECHESFEYVESILSKTAGTTEYQLKERSKKLASFTSFDFKNISWKVVVNTPFDEVSGFVENNFIQTLALIALITLTLIGFSFFISRSNKLKAKAEAEMEILRAKQAFNLILESAGEGIFGIDPAGNHTFVNPMAAKLLGYKPEELIGKHSHTIWHHTRQNGLPYPCEDCPIYETLKDKKTHRGEEYFWRKDGSGFQVDFSTSPILEDEKVVGAVVTFRDITERKLAEEALRVSEERFRSVTQSANDAIIIANRIGLILGWNRGAEKIFGFTEAEIIGKSLELIIPPNYRDKHDTGMARLIATSEHHVIGKTMELQGLHKNGNVFPVELTLSEWETSEDKYFTGIIRDISDRKKVEAEQEKQREILEKLNGLSGLLAEDLILVKSLEKGLQIILSTSFLRLEQIGGVFLVETGKNELVLKCGINLPKALETMCARVPLGHCLCGRAASIGEIQYSDCVDERHENRYQGIQPHGHYNIPIISDREILGVIVVYLSEGHHYNSLEVSFLQSAADIFSAIINRKQAEDEIKSKNEQLQKTNSEKDKFFSIIAHDLRSPFNGFLNLTEMMAEGNEDFSKTELTDFSKSMHESVSTVYKLLENLLEWAQMQKGTISFTPVELLLSKAVLFSINTITQRALQKGITIIDEVSETQKVYADEKMINTVLRNLLSNAVKFTRKNGKVIVSVKAIGNEMVEVSVADTGVGMNKNDLEKLFKIEEKVSSKGTEGEPSSGLGLLLCKEFVEKHGGKIWVESEVNKGSIFYFTIPQNN